MFQSHEPVHLILAAASRKIDKQLRAGKNVVCALYFCACSTFFHFSAHKQKKSLFFTLTSISSSLNTLKWTYSRLFQWRWIHHLTEHEGVSYLHYLLILIIKPQSLEVILVYFHNEVQDDSQSCNYMEMHGPEPQHQRHHRFHGITGVITITFIKIISYGKYVIVARKYDDASFVWLALQCYVLSAGTRTSSGKWPLPQHSCSLSAQVRVQLPPVSMTGGYYTHLKSEGQLGAMHNVSEENHEDRWRSSFETKLHYKSRLLARIGRYRRQHAGIIYPLWRWWRRLGWRHHKHPQCLTNTLTKVRGYTTTCTCK
jgi:hypothetical protein